jgi:uncharacterized protein with HEPN domain
MQLIEGWITGGYDAFMSDEQQKAAVLRMLHELSESVQRLQPLYRDQYPDLPCATATAPFLNYRSRR